MRVPGLWFMVWGSRFGVEGFLGLGFGLEWVEPGPLRFKATLRQGGGEGGGGVGGGVDCFDCLWSWRTVRLRTPVSQGGYPFEAKKRGPKKGFGCGGRIWRGVPVLTTYTPPARRTQERGWDMLCIRGGRKQQQKVTPPLRFRV